jgi:hypothetical protein
MMPIPTSIAKKATMSGSRADTMLPKIRTRMTRVTGNVIISPLVASSWLSFADSFWNIA